MEPAQRQPVWERLLAETSWPRKGTLVAGLEVDVTDRIAGFAGLRPTRDEERPVPETVAEIAALYLAPDVQGTGIGRRLMLAALDTFAEARYQQATLWVLDTNARARRFYEAGGWQTDGAVKHDAIQGFPLTEIRYRHPLG